MFTRATEFEYGHQTLLSQLLIAAGLATYLFDPEDVVWRFIKDQPGRRELEHAIFFFATVLIGGAAVLCTRARAQETNGGDRRVSRRYRTGEFLYATGLGTLMPLAGFVILVAGQAIRILRLAEPPDHANRPSWTRAMRGEAAKWGLAANDDCLQHYAGGQAGRYRGWCELRNVGVAQPAGAQGRDQLRLLPRADANDGFRYSFGDRRHLDQFRIEVPVSGQTGHAPSPGLLHVLAMKM